VDSDQRLDSDLLGPVVRAFRLIRAVAEADGPLSGKEISDLLELPPSTSHRLLQLLGRIEVVERAQDGQKYVPGPELYRIAFAVMRKSDVTMKARPHLRAIVDQLNITTVLWLYLPSEQLLIASEVMRSRHSLDFNEVTFLPRGLVWGNVGRAVLAQLPQDEVDQIVAKASKSPTGLVIEPKKKLREELAKIRAQGYAYSEGHTVREALGFSAPLFDYRGMVIGCIGCTMPAMRFNRDDFDRYVDVITEQARGLSAELGYAPKSLATGDA
jgi:DNA-binding IclR family transcriptional regulator